MSVSRYIRVMISSRCNDTLTFQGKQSTLSEVRENLRETIEGEKLFGKLTFEVWINESAPAAEGSSDSWDTCIEQVRDADLVVVLYNGNAGWTKESGGVGICHAELQAALEDGAAKVRIISIPPADKATLRSATNESFKKYVASQSRFWSAAKTGDEIIPLVRDALHAAVIDMVRLGTREARKGKYDTGGALDWSRLDFVRRKESMERVMRECLKRRSKSRIQAGRVIVSISDRELLMETHAIPGPTSLAAARELVGQPFTKDYLSAPVLRRGIVGPVHLIACQKTVSESQCLSIIGVPDVIIVGSSFGMFVADKVNKVQLLFLANCRDETTTKIGIQRALEWLDQSGEDRLVIERAASRAKIVHAVAKEQQN